MEDQVKEIDRIEPEPPIDVGDHVVLESVDIRFAPEIVQVDGIRQRGTEWLVRTTAGELLLPFSAASETLNGIEVDYHVLSAAAGASYA